ncbi:2-amino-4-hydroxy-6-hydroxymethyldihydropteridine diphosphokinase [Shewanella sp. Scap07]|uniref:2-amino-4-hydroxy-6- hydroxymethyldihydropteridine diphosphokinase n=1 Tax=Shewanella sp. Scap07 TaxID=2589987 RepID=UPI0015B930F9|nr:2-amino-4-hydroxy-6-hydroxymethyldihydropteridine diphosphokinase [Shewanella sp. Scap07]QLE84240.1 2-amino-4-hydroxy-6-hydroxymethyldihydropteridine diphosphokinase [Shewanella sp. Scap07]
MLTTVYVALGANLAQPHKQLDDAVQALTQLAKHTSLQVSAYYQSTPMGEVEQPDYLNAVVSFDTDLTPLALLDALQAIENQQGRERIVRWGARTLDLDILLYGQQVICSERLTVPHSGMKQRSFVLVPLADIAPALILPCQTPLSALIDDDLRAELQQHSWEHCTQR